MTADELLLTLLSVAAAVALAAIARRDKVAALVALPGVATIGLAWITVVYAEQLQLLGSSGPSAPVWNGTDLVRAGWMMAGVGSTAVMVALGCGFGFPAVAGRSSSAADRVPLPRRTALGLALVSFVLTVAGVIVYGALNLLARDEYIPVPAVPALASFAGILIPVAFVCSLIVLYSGPTSYRAATLVMLSVQTIAVFAMASRQLALLPLLAVAIAYFLGLRLRPIAYVSAAAAALLATALVVALRSLPYGSHGLTHYSAAIASGSMRSSTPGFLETAGNFAFSIPLAGYVADLDVFTPADLALSLNPLPSSGADWALRSPSLRVHFFIPFNSVGELASISPILLAGAVALATSLAYIVVRHTSSREIPFVPQVVLVLYYFAFVLSLQYNTRSVARFLYAILALVAISGVISLLRPQAKGSTRRIGASARHTDRSAKEGGSSSDSGRSGNSSRRRR